MSVAGLLDAMRAPVCPATRLVWMCLENHANGHRWWRMTEKQIADELSLSAATVARAIGWLASREQKIIRVERQKRRPTVFHMLRSYLKPQPDLTQQNVEQTDLTHKNVDSTEAQMTTKNVESTDGLPSKKQAQQLELTPKNADSYYPPVRKNPPKENPPESSLRSDSRARKSATRDFVEFYLAYPRKVAKRRAAEAYAKAIERGATHQEIMRGLLRQRFNIDPKYQPHPATWLNGDRWQDEPPPPKPEYDPENLTGWAAELYRIERDRTLLAKEQKQQGLLT
jgi:hypothetical protein